MGVYIEKGQIEPYLKLYFLYQKEHLEVLWGFIIKIFNYLKGM